jgi:hypothetical protein
MGRGKPWTDAENQLLLEMVNEGLTPREIFESGKFPDRTQDSIRTQIQRLGGGSFVQTKHTAIVQTIEPDQNTLTVEDIVRHFTSAFKQICALQEVDKLTLERFRIIFQAAKDYLPLFKTYEKWDEVDKRLNEIEEMLQQLQAQRKTAQCQPPP